MSCAEVRSREKAVDVAVGFEKVTVSVAYAVVPATALYAVVLVVLRKAIVSVAEFAVALEQKGASHQMWASWAAGVYRSSPDLVAGSFSGESTGTIFPNMWPPTASCCQVPA